MRVTGPARSGLIAAALAAGDDRHYLPPEISGQIVIRMGLLNLFFCDIVFETADNVSLCD